VFCQELLRVLEFPRTDRPSPDVHERLTHLGSSLNKRLSRPLNLRDGRY
jgi:hypothetical protein